MKQFKYPAIALVVIATALFLGACASKQRAVFNTLYSVEHSTMAAYDTYAYGVIRGQWPTNGLPKVSQDYDRFQIGMRAAVEVAQYDYSAIAPSNVVQLANVVLHSILEAKAR